MPGATYRDEESLAGGAMKHAPSVSAHKVHLWPMLLDIALHLYVGSPSNGGDVSAAYKTRVGEVMRVAPLLRLYSTALCGADPFAAASASGRLPARRWKFRLTHLAPDRWQEHIICCLGQQRTPATHGDKVCCRCTFSSPNA